MKSIATQDERTADPASESPTRPALRYHGGKWKLAPWIISRFPDHRVYVEPYGGAASVLLRKPRSYAEIYNDLDGEIVNYFRVLRDHPRQLQRLLSLTPFSRDEFRLSFELSDDPIEQARRTAIRSQMGFGGNSLNRSIQSGFRANSNRSGTTPAHDWANIPPNTRLLGRRMRGVVIENRPAIQVMQAHDAKHTLHYVDPPYVHATRSIKAHGHHGYTHEMTNDDHRELAKELHGMKGMVIVSGYHSALYDDLFGKWYREERKALADGARPRTEVLWFNDAAHAAVLKKSANTGLFAGIA